MTFIIAEAGVNHNGSLELAKKLIEVAAESGADAVKFQTFQAEKLISRFAQKADYQKKNTGTSETQLEMLKKLQLSEDDHHQLVQHCKVHGIQFLSTPFDSESLQFLMNEIGMKQLKVPSGEITNAPYLLEMAKFGVPMILSTGMSTFDEVQTALGVLAFGLTKRSTSPSLTEFETARLSSEGQAALLKNVTILHCTSDYPAVPEEINLRAMQSLSESFGLRMGLSDHSEGISVPIAAVALGAQVIEKHFTSSRALPGPDHRASLEPQELAEMIRSIRIVEKALGNGEKIPFPSELKTRVAARKSLVAKESIQKGEKFSEKNLTVKRPGNGISPLLYWDYLKKTADRDYQPDEMIANEG